MRGVGLALLIGLVASCGGNTVESSRDAGTGGTPAGGGSGGTSASGGTAGSGGATAGAAGAAGAAGCNFEVVASGQAAAGNNLAITGPDVAVTDDGFVVAFRTETPNPNQVLKVVLMGVSDAGIATDPAALEVGGCSGMSPTDGLGLAYRDGSGLLAAGVPNCGTGAGAALVPFDSSGKPGTAVAPKNASFSSLTLANGGALAPASTTGEYELVYRVVQNGTPAVERAVLQGTGFKSIPFVHPFGDGDVPFGRVVTTSTVRAILGQPAGSDQIEVQVGPLSGDALYASGTFQLPPASFAALHAWQSRVVAGAPGPDGFEWKAVALDGNSLVDVASATIPKFPAESADFAVVNEHLLLALGSQHNIVMRRYDLANGNIDPNPVAVKFLPSLLGSEDIADFDGKHLAMAAARDLVALAWVTAIESDFGTYRTASWALLSCSK